MLFFPVLASLFAFGTLTAVASPAPVVEKREDVADVLRIVNSLQSETGSVLPQIDSLVNSDKATAANIEPLAIQLVNALNSGGSSLEALGRVNANSGGTKEEVAQKTADIYSNVTKTLNNVKTKKPHLYPFFPKHGIEAALLKVLLGLEIVLAGVLKLVGGLLKLVGGLLSGLGFLLITLLLGL